MVGDLALDQPYQSPTRRHCIRVLRRNSVDAETIVDIFSAP